MIIKCVKTERLVKDGRYDAGHLLGYSGGSNEKCHCV